MARKKATAPNAEPSVTAKDEMPKPATCPDCLKVLDWRDAAYVLGSTRCKKCHQRAQETKLRGVFHPAGQMVKKGGKLVFVPTLANRAQRRHGRAR